MTMSTQVFDVAPAQFRRMMKTAGAVDEAPASVIDDLADCVVAVHQLANLAGFSERPRALILALAGAARTRDNSQVELFDEELAGLQNCSVKTVQRQRADYFAEACERRLHLVEIVEGDYDRGAGKNVPTRYRFHLAGAVEKVVRLARSSSRWHASDRRKQCEAISRAAATVFEEIPRAGSRSRKKRKPRTAADEIETCLKVAAAKLQRAQELAARLPVSARGELLDEEDSRGLRRRWLEMRAAMDTLFDNSPQTDEETGVDEGGGQFVQEQEDEDGFKSGTSAEVRETWERRFGCLTEPRVLSRDIALHPPPPAPSPPSEEELEAEAIRTEGCGEVP